MDNFFELTIRKLKEKNMFRKLKKIKKIKKKYIYIGEEKLIDFSSNNYLGLTDNEKVKEAVIKAINKYGVGSGASRLVTGNTEIHSKFEKELAEFKGKEKALLFNSGYDANIGIISSIMGKNDIIFCDRLNHASIIDGILLSGARFLRYKHNDIIDLEKKMEKHIGSYKKIMVVTDSVFSMDGDKAKLKQISKLKEKYDFIFMIDEAHGTGVLGENGKGLAEEQEVMDKIDLNMGTLGKAFGVQGAYVAGNSEMIEYLINKSRSLIYTTAISPIMIAGAQKSLDIIKKEPERREKIIKMSNYFRSEIIKLGYNLGESETNIVPIILGDNKKVLELSDKLYQNGILAPAIRYPTVEKGKERIRFSINYNLNYEDLDKVINVLKQQKNKRGVK